MAANANSTTAPAIATALSMQADAVASAKLKTIRSLAETLAALMQDIHGGSWRADIHHEDSVSMVLIRPKAQEPLISKPKRGEAV
jgi:hypothetical protein